MQNIEQDNLYFHWHQVVLCFTRWEFIIDELKEATLPPSPPSSFKILDITSRAAYFTWHPPRYIRSTSLQHGSPEITGYVIEYKNGRGSIDWSSDKVSRYEIKDGNTVAACVSNLAPWTTYHFRIISLSKNVTSVPSSSIIVRTAEDVPSAPPLQVKVKNKDFFHFPIIKLVCDKDINMYVGRNCCRKYT